MFSSDKRLEGQFLLLNRKKKKLQWKNWGGRMGAGDGDQGNLSLLWKIVLCICKSQKVSREETAGFFSSP